MLSSEISYNSGATLTQTAPEDIVSKFWQQWTEQKDQLYRCCLKLMNFNSTDAEDALSQAMLKAWEKVQKYAGKIDNLKAWLVQLTRNLCIDMIRQRSRGTVGVESLEWVGATENVDTVSAVDTPEKALEKDEKARVIQEAVASLPERLRHSFILHFYQQCTHAEIADEQGITYDNVCKRISLARKEIKQRLSGYFQGTKERVSSKVWPSSGEKEIKEVKKEKLESVECCVEPREEAAPVVEETTTISAQKVCNEEVKSENLEAVERKELPQKQVSNTKGDVVDASGENLLCRRVAVSWLSNIASLPERLRHTFILHFYQQRTHAEIADEQGITYDNVCKRISLARKELKERLSGYFQGTKERVSSKVSPSSGEKEIKEVKKEKLESVECCVEPTEQAAPVVEETTTVSAQKVCNEEVKSENLEAVERKELPKEQVSNTKGDVVEQHRGFIVKVTGYVYSAFLSTA